MQLIYPPSTLVNLRVVFLLMPFEGATEATVHKANHVFYSNPRRRLEKVESPSLYALVFEAFACWSQVHCDSFLHSIRKVVLNSSEALLEVGY